MPISDPARFDGTPTSGFDQQADDSRWLNTDTSTSLVSTEIEKNFYALLPRDQRIERVYWDFEHDILRIWSIVDRPNFELEKQIYAAQSKFMDIFPELECDFSVVYRFGKPHEHLKPMTAKQIYTAS